METLSDSTSFQDVTPSEAASPQRAAPAEHVRWLCGVCEKSRVCGYELLPGACLPRGVTPSMERLQDHQLNELQLAAAETRQLKPTDHGAYLLRWQRREIGWDGQ